MRAAIAAKAGLLVSLRGARRCRVGGAWRAAAVPQPTLLRRRRLRPGSGTPSAG